MIWAAAAVEGPRLAIWRAWLPSCKTMLAAEPRALTRSILLISRCEICSPEGSFQSLVITFHITGFMPRRRAARNTTGRRAPYGGGEEDRRGEGWSPVPQAA